MLRLKKVSRRQITPYIAVVAASVLPLTVIVPNIMQHYVSWITPPFIQFLLTHQGSFLGLSAASAILLSVLLMTQKSDWSQLPLVLAVLIGGVASWTAAWHSLDPEASELSAGLVLVVTLLVLVSSIGPLLIQMSATFELPRSLPMRLLLGIVALPILLLLYAGLLSTAYGTLLEAALGLQTITEITYVVILLAFMLAAVLGFVLSLVVAQGQKPIKAKRGPTRSNKPQKSKRGGNRRRNRR